MSKNGPFVLYGGSERLSSKEALSWFLQANKIRLRGYLKSSHWSERKQRFLSARQAQSKSYRVCWHCKKREDVGVYHRTFRNIGNELDSDLVILCGKCKSLEIGSDASKTKKQNKKQQRHKEQVRKISSDDFDWLEQANKDRYLRKLNRPSGIMSKSPN